MRSRAEWALRAAAVIALSLLLWNTLRPQPAAGRASATRHGLERALADATRERVPAISVQLDSTPGPVHREWLAAIRSAGTSVTWRAPGVVPIALGVTRVAAPESRVRVTVGGPDSSRVIISDVAGPLDTAIVQRTQAARLLRTASASVSAAGGGSRAMMPIPPPSTVRRLLVLGAAGWETKFVIAALEESGWTVDARIRVAPGVETRQGADYALDTTRYSAVIALDASAAPLSGAMERFAKMGGGVVLGPAATRLPAFARVTPATAASARVVGPRPALRLAALKQDAVVLDSEGAGAVMAARRAGLGRVVAIGYDETWRWRMRPTGDASVVHRDWWTAVVSAVAYVRPAGQRAPPGVYDPAPVAALTAALGPPADAVRTAESSAGWMPPVWLLFLVAIGSLLAEVVSRRTRGLA